MKRLLDYDPLRGVSCYMDVDHATNKLTLTHEQDVSAILEQNRREAADEGFTSRGIKHDWWKYASVPAIVEIEWLNKFGVDLANPGHKRKVFQLLNHPDYKYLKTTSKYHTINVE
jgi:hypothetical protein